MVYFDFYVPDRKKYLKVIFHLSTKKNTWIKKKYLQILFGQCGTYKSKYSIQPIMCPKKCAFYVNNSDHTSSLVLLSGSTEVKSSLLPFAEQCQLMPGAALQTPP